MKRSFLFAALAAFAWVHGLAAQQPNAGNPQNAGKADPRNPPKPPPIIVWKAELPGGSFMVARNAINAISTQQYILDGAARVTEVNISTSGVFQPRFYYIEPLAAAATEAVPGAQAVADHVQALVQTGVNRVVPGDPVWAKVVKNYPTTTHAGTIEFRLETQDQLDKLYQSVERTWTTGKSEVFTPAGAKPYHARKPAGDDDEPEKDPAGDTDSSAAESNPATPN